MILLKDICTEQSLNVYDFIKGYMYGPISELQGYSQSNLLTYMILLKDICTDQSLNVYDFIKGYMYGPISELQGYSQRMILQNFRDDMYRIYFVCFIIYL